MRLSPFPGHDRAMETKVATASLESPLPQPYFNPSARSAGTDHGDSGGGRRRPIAVPGDGGDCGERG